MTDYLYPETLLPPNHSALERHLEMVIRRRFDELPVEVIRQFWHPENCPAHLLPHLARQFSVDVWRENWPEERKRAVIAASPYLHRIKGTRAAIETAMRAMGQNFIFTEWWEEGRAVIPGYTPAYCTAWLEIDGEQLEASGVSAEDVMTALRMCKRMTLHVGVMIRQEGRVQDYRENILVMPVATGGDTEIIGQINSRTLVAGFVLLQEMA